ncbi:hypothetical protein NECAME_15028 [Necator americanus]|uniref:Aminopeptidase N-like N-terminal domain-containing protein n=1 Tax=Necator americanus TaxID=51031 RepID=W2SMD1_NECAM|nr:hypothetical protein NECAME_15028 [Necator americanus]ETN69872.1 hypothetical protein NECAME_15028 [Necator americanus]
MAPANARRMVPCFDEPEYKATWNVTIIHPIGTRAIANSFEISETTSNGKRQASLSEFTQSPPGWSDPEKAD